MNNYIYTLELEHIATGYPHSIDISEKEYNLLKSDTVGAFASIYGRGAIHDDWDEHYFYMGVKASLDGWSVKQNLTATTH